MPTTHRSHGPGPATRSRRRARRGVRLAGALLGVIALAACRAEERSPAAAGWEWGF